MVDGIYIYTRDELLNVRRGDFLVFLLLTFLIFSIKGDKNYHVHCLVIGYVLEVFVGEPPLLYSSIQTFPSTVNSYTYL